jgi:glutamyl/glutaminyl-tRNA synthetase
MEEGKAYCDDTDPGTMKAEREQRAESKICNNSVDKNLTMWKFSLDQQKDKSVVYEGCMRDPTIYIRELELCIRKFYFD